MGEGLGPVGDDLTLGESSFGLAFRVGGQTVFLGAVARACVPRCCCGGWVAGADASLLAAHCGILGVAAGADVKAVQEMLGHSSAAMTLDLYGHLWARRLDEVADRVGALVDAEMRKKAEGQAQDRADRRRCGFRQAFA